MSQFDNYDAISKIDPDIAHAIRREKQRQNDTVQLIASENFTSKAILAAQGSIATNKYAEGLPGKRYYGGCEDVDVIETLAIDRAKQLFGADFANVQPHSGSSANLAIFAALLRPGDTILGMDLNAGGHLTHGHPVNFSGRFYQAYHYGVNEEGVIDYNQIEALAKQHKPKLIIAGFSAYSQVIDWAAIKAIAVKHGAYFLADMAHVSGLVAAGLYPSPVEHADIVTSTTHKTLRGPRGGMIISQKNSDIPKLVNKAIFPGTQGGPLMHVITAKAICYLEAMQPEFKSYQAQVIKNAQIMAKSLMDEGFDVISGTPKCHMFLLSVAKQGLSGHHAQDVLEKAGIIVNKNSIPNDPLPPNKTSGIRIGSQAMTTRGMTEDGAKQVATWIAKILTNPSEDNIKSTKSAILAYLPTLKAVPDLP